MGRPKRINKEQRETTRSSRQLSQSTHSPNSPISSQAASKSLTAGDIWPGHNLEDSVGLSLVGLQYQDSLDFGLHHTAVEDDLLDISPWEGCFEQDLDFDTPFLSSEDSAVNTTTAERPSTELAPEVNDCDCYPPIQQESVQRVSSLNLELYRQLSIIGPMANEHSEIEPSLEDLVVKSKCLSGAVVFMIQGLQTFQELLIGILGLSSLNFHHDNRQRAVSRNVKPSSTGLPRLTDGRDEDWGKFMSAATTWNQPKVTCPSERGAELRVSERSPPVVFLDMPTSFLIMSCYINLIQLCRDVFAAIRASLPEPRHQTTLFKLSGLQINGVSIHEDSDLQIVVLIQAVVRLVDRLEHVLGYPYSCATKSGKTDGAKACRKAISPQLLNFVLRQDGIWEQPLYKVGIEAFREEIRRLHELVYKPV